MPGEYVIHVLFLFNNTHIKKLVKFSKLGYVLAANISFTRRRNALSIA